MRIQNDNNFISKLPGNTGTPISSRQGTKDQKCSDSVVLDETLGKLLARVEDPADGVEKVQKARCDLKNGQLDTQEAVLSAAENLIKFGI